MSNFNATINIILHHDSFSLSCGDVTAQLTPKDFAILQSFKDSKTETISRQSLIKTHFPQSNVNSEQLLNNAIYRMRSGLRTVTELDNPIITVHKQGYKLHKAIYLQEDEFAQPNPADTRRLMLTSLTSASLIFGVLVIAVILNVTAETTPEPLQPISALPLSSTLLLQQRSAPQVSANGEHLTYVGVDLQGNEHLYQQSLLDASSPLPQRIPLLAPSQSTSETTDNSEKIDTLATDSAIPLTAQIKNDHYLDDQQYSAGVWSPDSSHIAFTSLSAQQDCRVKIYSQRSHTVMDVAQCRDTEYTQPLKNTTDWSPDGTRLYFVNTAVANEEAESESNLAYYDITTRQVVTVKTALKAGLDIAQPTVLNASQIAFTVTDKKDRMRVAIHDLPSNQTSVAPTYFAHIRGMSYLPARKQILLSAKATNQFQMYTLQLPTNDLSRLLILSSHDLVEPSVSHNALYFTEEHQIPHNITMSRQGKLHAPFLDLLNTSVNAFTQPLLTNRAVFFTYQLAQQWHLGYVQRNQPDIVTNITTENRIELVSATKGFATAPDGDRVVYVNQGENSREKLTLFNIDTRENRVLLTANNKLWNFHHPFWSQCDNAVLFSAAYSAKDYSYLNQSSQQASVVRGNTLGEQLLSASQPLAHQALVNRGSNKVVYSNRRKNTLYGWRYQPDTQKLSAMLDNPASKMVASDDCRYIAYTNRDANGIALYDRIEQQTLYHYPHLKKQQYQLISQVNNALYFVANHEGKYAIYRTPFWPFKPERLYHLPLPDMIKPHSIQALDNDKVVLSYSTMKSDLQKIMLDDLH